MIVSNVIESCFANIKHLLKAIKEELKNEQDEKI
jgi:hypothetical protein